LNSSSSASIRATARSSSSTAEIFLAAGAAACRVSVMKVVSVDLIAAMASSPALFAPVLETGGFVADFPAHSRLTAGVCTHSIRPLFRGWR
jgi:hypothetical protein